MPVPAAGRNRCRYWYRLREVLGTGCRRCSVLSTGCRRCSVPVPTAGGELCRYQLREVTGAGTGTSCERCSVRAVGGARCSVPAAGGTRCRYRLQEVLGAQYRLQEVPGAGTGRRRCSVPGAGTGRPWAGPARRCSVPFSSPGAPRAPHRSQSRRTGTVRYRDVSPGSAPPPHPQKGLMALGEVAGRWRGSDWPEVGGAGRVWPGRAAAAPAVAPRPPPAEPCAPRRCSGCCFGLRCFGLRRRRCAAAATASTGTGATPGSAAHRGRTEPRAFVCAGAARPRTGSGTGSGRRCAPCGRRSVPERGPTPPP